jgi:Flp pilus assembly protein TadG
MVEAAFVMPIFVLFLFGIIEFSGFLLSKEGTTNAAQAGARMASVQGKDAMADQQILVRLSAEAAGIPNGEIKQVIIWHASGPSDTPPAACLAVTGNGGVTDNGPADDVGACNVYGDPQAPGGAFSLANGTTPATYFGCPLSGPTTGQLDCSWNPVNRKTQQQKPGTVGTATPDYVGIYIKAVHRYYTGLFGSTVNVTDQSIGKIEPGSYTT